jgi:hypothetical protein
VIASNYVALVLYVGLRVAGGLVSYLLRVRPLRDLFMVQRHRAFLQGRIELLLRWVSIGTWAYFTVEWLGVTPFLSSTGLRILRVRYGHGPVSFSAEDVLAFVLTVAGAFLLSAFIRFVLEEDVPIPDSTLRGNLVCHLAPLSLHGRPCRFHGGDRGLGH